MIRRLTDDLLSQAKTFDQRIAVSECSGNAVSYALLGARVKQFSGFLRQKGLVPGARVALLQSKSIESLISILSVLDCGGTYIPVDPAMSANRIQLLLRDADPDMLIADPKLFPSEIPCQFEICALVPGMENTGITVFNSGSNPDANLAYILYTSGSTGTPKGVCVSHTAVNSFVEWSMNAFQLKAGDQVASIAPFHFDLSVFDIYASLLSGCTIHLFNAEEVKNVRLMAQELSARNISVIYATPSFYVTLLLYGKPAKFSWNFMHKVLFAGEVFPVQHLHFLMQLWSEAEFFNLYGPTETNVCTWTKITADENRTMPYPIGLPCSGHGHEISPEGELLIGGPHVAEGYLNQPELTEARFFTRNNLRWFRTGDLVEMDAKGELLYKGRIDRMIKRRGYRIEPAEVEYALLLHPGILSCAVVDVKGSDDLPLLIAFAVGNVPELMEVKQFLLDHLPDYMLPDRIVTVESMPVTSTGKTDYEALQKSFSTRLEKE